MRPGHQTAAVADPGYTAAGRGADVHRHQLPSAFLNATELLEEFQGI
jgi:hypothetical protein